MMCYQHVRQLKKYQNLTFVQLVMAKLNIHFNQEHPDLGDPDFDEELHGKFEIEETKSLIHSKSTEDTEIAGDDEQ